MSEIKFNIKISLLDYLLFERKRCSVVNLKKADLSITQKNEADEQTTKYSQQELHSSRMHTARLLTVTPSMHCAGGSPCQGGLPCRGIALPGGGIPVCTEADPTVNRITDACENITLPQLRCGL